MQYNIIIEKHKGVKNISFEDYFKGSADNKNYFIWINGAVRVFENRELKNYLYEFINVPNLKAVEKTNYNGLEWINEVLNDAINYA